MTVAATTYQITVESDRLQMFNKVKADISADPDCPVCAGNTYCDVPYKCSRLRWEPAARSLQAAAPFKLPAACSLYVAPCTSACVSRPQARLKPASSPSQALLKHSLPSPPPHV